MADAVIGTVLTFVGLPGLLPLPWWQTLEIFVYAMVSCLVVNDAVKVAMIKWRVPAGVASANRSRSICKGRVCLDDAQMRPNRSFQQTAKKLRFLSSAEFIS